MEIVVLKQAEKELRDGPKELIEDIYSLFDDLSQGKSLGMPISRPLPFVHACTKKKQAIDKKTTGLHKNRIRSIDL